MRERLTAGALPVRKAIDCAVQSARDVAFALGALSGSSSGTVQSGVSAIGAFTPPTRTRGPLVLAAAVAAALIPGGSAGYFARGTSGATIAAVSYSPVTFEDGFVFAARFAPDARTIVYSADRDGHERDVFVTSLDSREYRPSGIPGADRVGISRSGELAILTGSTITGGNPYFRIGTLAKASLTGGAPRAELEGTLFADLGANGEMARFRPTFASQSSLSSLRVGDPFPELKGRSLTGRDAALPQAASGKVALVAMGFTYESRFPVEAWADWYRKTVGSRADVTLFEVPMLGRLATLGRWFIDRGMRKGTPVELHDRVITVYGDTGAWKRRLSYSSEHKDDAYLMVLDTRGVVRWLHHGGFDQSRADDLHALLTSLADRGPTAADHHLAPRSVEP